MSDWRETLFVWRGLLSIDEKMSSEDQNADVRWEGSWLPLGRAEAAAVLTDSAFAQSPTKFSQRSFTQKIHKGMHRSAGLANESSSSSSSVVVGGGAAEYPYLRWKWPSASCHYLMDPSSSRKKKYRDIEHDIYVWPLGQQESALDTHFRWAVGTSGPRLGAANNTCVAAVACIGYNEFGKFISSGFIEQINSSEEADATQLRMTVARRYVEDEDSRNTANKWCTLSNVYSWLRNTNTITSMDPAALGIGIGIGIHLLEHGLPYRCAEPPPPLLPASASAWASAAEAADAIRPSDLMGKRKIEGADAAAVKKR